jgi:hypothetical protein
MKNKMNNLRRRLIASLEAAVAMLENEIKKIESIRCGREEWKENVRKIKVLKLRKFGAEQAIIKHKAALV